MDTTSTRYYNEIAASYDADYKTPFWRMYNEVTWNYLKDCLPENKTDSLVLDAGGGTGLWAVKLAKLGYRVVLTDVSEGMLDVAEKKVVAEGLSDRIRIINSDITDMRQFQDNAFDLVLAEGDPVSYCSAPQKAIKELSRVCRKAGYITVSVDNKLTWMKRSVERCDFAAVDKIMSTGIAMMPTTENTGYPAFTFTIDELEAIFRKNNVRLVRTVGKPVFAGKHDLEDEDIYNKLLEYELRYASVRWLAATGGHIAVIGQKEY
ncbi:MAG: methyltransferase domain-containing protein [Victivallaceae bacterium]|nr:methyltransferase domain-containing protein [Victivallaceae bacterium]